MTISKQINGYHAHVYYTDDISRAIAGRIREYVEHKFTVVMGRWRDDPVGPHPLPMYQMAFDNNEFASLVPWLMLNHDSLSVLIHPNTNDMVADHRYFAIWLGEKLDLNITFLDAGNTSA